MKTLSVAMALLLAICLAVLTACGGGEGESELEQALQSVTEKDLAIMVLPQEDLGEEFADLEIDEDSGFVDNEQAADGTIDPDDTADDLERAGRIKGYELKYVVSNRAAALVLGEGPFEVGTEVELFEDGDAACDYLAKQIHDWQRLESEDVEVGLTLQKVETFGVGGLADEAVGLRTRFSFGDLQLYGTVVAFRLDRLVGSAVVYRADDTNVNSQVEAIARALEQRIEGVLLGDVVGTPAPLPQAEEEATVAPAPGDGISKEDLPSLVLKVEDMPQGFQATSEGYRTLERQPGHIAQYRVNFERDPDTFAQSRVSLYDDESFAQAAVRSVDPSRLPEGATFEEGPEAPEDLGDVSGSVYMELKLEDKLVARGYLLHFAIGRLYGQVQLYNIDSSVPPFDEVVQLARVQAQKMRAAPPPQAAARASLTPTPAAGVSGPSCQFPEDITSYRYTMEMSMEAPELMEDLMEGLEGAGEEEEGLGAALGEFFGSFLMAFTQGMTVEGAYVAPDRSWDRMTLGGKPFAEVIQIGDRSWFRLGGMDWTESGAELPSQEEGVTSQVSVTISPTSPEALCEISTIDVMSMVEGMEPQKETVNGVKAVHYHIDEADLQLLAALFGEGEGIEEMPESATGTMDVWLAEDGNWPVRVEGEVSYTDEQGRSISLEVFMEIKDINDPDIEIEPPI